LSGDSTSAVQTLRLASLVWERARAFGGGAKCLTTPAVGHACGAHVGGKGK